MSNSIIVCALMGLPDVILAYRCFLVVLSFWLQMYLQIALFSHLCAQESWGLLTLGPKSFTAYHDFIYFQNTQMLHFSLIEQVFLYRALKLIVLFCENHTYNCLHLQVQGHWWAVKLCELDKIKNQYGQLIEKHQLQLRVCRKLGSDEKNMFVLVDGFKIRSQVVGMKCFMGDETVIEQINCRPFIKMEFHDSSLDLSCKLVQQ